MRVLNVKISTHVVHKNEKISINYDTNNDYYSIVSNENLKKGTFILLEHVLTSYDYNDLIINIQNDRSLSETLYPRKMPDMIEKFYRYHLQEQGDELDDKIPNGLKNFLMSPLLQSKVDYNYYKFDSDPPLWVLGNAISKINHDCIPNCSVYPVTKVGDNVFYGIWSIKDIKKGDELTVDYVEGGGSISDHNELKKKFNFTCSCSDDFIRASKERYPDPASLLGASHQNVQKLLIDYLQSDVLKSVLQKRRNIDVSETVN